MKYATRLNSFLNRDGQTLETALTELGSIDGITCVDLNYPQHFAKHTVDQIRVLLENNRLQVNGLGIRFEDDFSDGEFTNRNYELSQRAETICMDAVKACRQLGGKIVTVWQAFDGFDYPFQVDYPLAWQTMVHALQRIADAAAPDILISVEYKPFQPRSFSLVPNMATAMLLIEEIGKENVGITLDFCHMLMAGDNPAAALALVAAKGRLYGIHLNDGYRLNDDGLMAGSVHPLQTLEFLFYAIRYNYQNAIFFDTFPIREDPVEECRQNIQTIERFVNAINDIGMGNIESMLRKQSGMTSTEILHRILR